MQRQPHSRAPSPCPPAPKLGFKWAEFGLRVRFGDIHWGWIRVCWCDGGAQSVQIAELDWVEVWEAKMKPRKGNGTPHPKGRRSLVHTPHEERNQCRQLHHDAPEALNNETRSSLENLLHVHTQVTRTLHQIDMMVLNMRKLASSSHVADAEVRCFADALANVDANLQDWNNFLKAAAERSSLSHSHLGQEHPATGSPQLTPPCGHKCARLSPLITDLDFCSISHSPLVTSDLLDCESPCDSECLMSTPDNSSSLSPLPQTPHMLSPLRSTRPLSTISESPSLSNSDYQQTPSPEGLRTPKHATETQLVFETPSPQITGPEAPNDDIVFLQTPGFGVSPPRTCHPLRPGETGATESDNAPSTPVLPSPFRTPGILFACSSSVTSESCSSAGSVAIVDNLTTSMVKHLGPRGLEERLWQELATRKADMLQFR